MIGESERIYLREFAEIDAQALYELNANAEVLKYTGDKPFLSVHEAAQFVKDYDQYSKYGYGRWAIVLKSNDACIGWCGLKYHPKSKEVDIGFRLNRNFWNQGFATEAAQLALKVGFEDLKLPRIIGRVMEENVASKRVLDKIGMKNPIPFIFDEHDGLKYELNRNDYERGKGLPANQ